MYTDEQFEKLEQEERVLTDEAIVLMLLILTDSQFEFEKELRIFYQRYGKDGVVTYAEARKWISEKDHRRRLTALLLVFSAAFSKILTEIKPHFEELLSNVIEKESEFFDIKLKVKKLLPFKWGADKSTWLKRLEKDVALWENYVLTDIKQSILKRENIDDVIEQLDGRFKTMKNVLKRLVLTESTAIGSRARQEIFEELGIIKYRFYTKPDERRCEQCGAMHGLEFPISAYEVGVTASPIHSNCRCWEVPIIDD